jgi:mRNA interferase MazF
VGEIRDVAGCDAGANGLRVPCQIMVDKITSVPKTKIGKRIGRLDDSDMLRLNRAVIAFLGLAASPRSSMDA